jgi:hypothetical protein
VTIVVHGPAPDTAEVAAVTAAVAAILDEEARAAAHDPLPPVYRSPWRQAAIREGLRSPLEVPIRR